MRKNQKLQFQFRIKRTIIYSCIFVILLITLLFDAQISEIFKLKPNLNTFSNALEIHFVDVGQGDATLIRFPNNKTMLIDSGGLKFQNNLKNYINNIFFKNNERVFDYIVITHSDMDHIGNMQFIFSNYKINNVFVPNETILNLLDENDVTDLIYINLYNNILEKQNNGELNIFYNFAGLEIKNNKSDEVYAKWLSPNVEYVYDVNDYSPIILFEYEGKRVITTGDASSSSEISCIGNFLIGTVDVLKLGHHGSGNSTSESFLEELDPTHYIISVGKNNIYNFPANQTLSRMVVQNPNALNNIYRTDLMGNIICTISNFNIQFQLLENISAYIYFDYYKIVIILEALIIILYFMPKIVSIKK